MIDKSTRIIRIGDWQFEVKAVRASRIENGKVTATANCNINGDNMYIDGLLTHEGREFTKPDFLTFHKYSKQMGLANFSYHRFHHGESVNKEIDVKDSKD